MCVCVFMKDLLTCERAVQSVQSLLLGRQDTLSSVHTALGSVRRIEKTRDVENEWLGYTVHGDQEV